ncbi:hypothetical protein Tco_1246635 [Tanacetum coccineum]
MWWEPLPKDVVDASWQMEVNLGVVAKFTWSRDEVYLEWWPRVLIGVQGGDGGGRVLARWLPTLVLNGKCPYQLIFSRKPSLNHLRAFGCLCFATILTNSDKFSSSSEPSDINHDLPHTNFFDEVRCGDPNVPYDDNNDNASSQSEGRNSPHPSSLTLNQIKDYFSHLHGSIGSADEGEMNATSDEHPSSSEVSHSNETEALTTKVANMILIEHLTLYDVLVVPGYCVNLMSIHKVARDIKFLISFDESHCYVLPQDLKEMKLLGIDEKKLLQYFPNFCALCKVYADSATSFLEVVLKAVQNPGVQNVGNQNALSVDPWIANQYGVRNVVTARAKGNGAYDEIEEVTANYGLAENDSNVNYAVSSVEQSGGIVEQHPATVKETCAYFESLYNNLAIEVEKFYTVNRKMRETNVDLTIELARYKNQEKCFEINQEKYDKLESSAKTITTLNEEIANLNNQLSKEKSTVSSLQKENKKLKSDFKIRKDELLDKQNQLENKIKELDIILVKTGDAATCLRESLKNETIKQRNKTGKLCKDSSTFRGFVSQKAESREELYFSNTSKMVKSTIVTLQRVVKQKMTLDIHNWSSTAHQELHKIVKDEIFPIINQVDARLQNFKKQFLKEAAKFVRDFKSLSKEADESLAKHKTLEFKIECLLRAVVSQDIMSVVQSNSVVDTSNLQTEFDRTKEEIENCIIKR